MMTCGSGNSRVSILFLVSCACAAMLSACGPSGDGDDLAADVASDVIGDAGDVGGVDTATPDAVDDDGRNDTLVGHDDYVHVDADQDTVWPDVPPIDVNDNIDSPPYARFINPFIGTQAGLFNVGNTFPGPGLPFGMVRLSPDTGDTYGATVYQHCGGYLWADPLIYGFSHNHLHGTGAPDYGDIQVMPVKAGSAKTKLTTFAASYDKASERAEAGYYKVELTDPAVKVELTSTTRCGYHRYTWPAGTEKGILAVDYGASLVESRSLGGQVVRADDGIYDGMNHHLGDFAARFDGYDVYFAMKFDREPAVTGVWHDGTVTNDTSDIVVPEGEETLWGGWFEFELGDNPTVELQVCLSYASNDGARANMAAELPAGKEFGTVRDEALYAWEDFVAKFATVGGDLDRKVNFYTALYHSAQMPQVWSDVTGEYQGFDKAVHTADGWKYYTDLSLWDTFRTQQPLIALVWPEVHRDINRSMLKMAEQSGNLPKWALAAGDTGSMIGQHAATIVADSYLKGITDFDVDATFDYLKACAEDTLAAGAKGRRENVESYNTMGYIPAEQNNSSVSVTLEYAFCDYCLAELAGAIGRTADEAVFRARAGNYRNVWDPELKFFRERNADGSWTAAPEEYDPTIMTFGGKNQGYTEGSGWQYRWFAPQDPAGLIELFEGVGSADDPGLFVTLLNQFFQDSKDTFNFQVPTGFYYHGNEPDIHAAYMFINAGRPDLTAYWTRWILDTSYRNEPEGLVGNDDAGTLAAWYVFTAAGLYPSPCFPGYFLTTPAFDSVVISLPGGEVVINAPGAADGSKPYITAATVDGVPIDIRNPWVTHDALKDGATIEMTLSATPPAYSGL